MPVITLCPLLILTTHEPHPVKHQLQLQRPTLAPLRSSSPLPWMDGQGLALHCSTNYTNKDNQQLAVYPKSSPVLRTIRVRPALQHGPASHHHEPAGEVIFYVSASRKSVGRHNFCVGRFHSGYKSVWGSGKARSWHERSVNCQNDAEGMTGNGVVRTIGPGSNDQVGIIASRGGATRS